MHADPGKLTLLAAIPALVLPGAVLPPASGATASCAAYALEDLFLALGRPVTRAESQQIAHAFPEEAASMLDIRQAAQRLGIQLRGVGATLSELAKHTPAPAIVHLTSPPHFVVTTRASPKWVQLIDRGRVAAAPRENIARRYSGHALILQQEHEEGGARLQLQQFHHAFGIAGVDQKIVESFALTNVGQAQLVVRPQSNGCCGAPDVSIGTETLAPGESTTVTISFTITHSGNVMKSAKLLTTDPMQPVVFLTVHGTVPHNVHVLPDRISFLAEKNDVAPRLVTVSGPEEMELTGAACEARLFDIRIGEPSVDQAGKKTWQLQITFKRDNFVGEIEDELAIHTTHEERPLITVPISGEIRGDLQVYPPSVFFGFVKPGDRAAHHATIESRAGNEFTIGAATADTAKVHVGEPHQQEDGAWRIPISVDTSEPGPVDGKLTVTTDVPGEKSLPIPVYAYIVKQE